MLVRTSREDLHVTKLPAATIHVKEGGHELHIMTETFPLLLAEHDVSADGAHSSKQAYAKVKTVCRTTLVDICKYQDEKRPVQTQSVTLGMLLGI